MVFTVMDNLRGFFNSRPPLVVFMICLGSFAVSLITFAYIVKVKNIKDSDVIEDWNTFLEKFAKLEFCMSQNASLLNASESRLSVSEQAPARVIQDIPKKLGEHLNPSKSEPSQDNTLRHLLKRAANERNEIVSHSLSTTDGLGLVMTSDRALSHKHNFQNVTVSLRFLVWPSADLQGLSLSHSQFVGALGPDTLSLHAEGDQERIQLRLSFPQNLSQSHCESMVGNVCSQYSVSVCATFTAPAHLLPSTRKPNEETCKSQLDTSQEVSVRNLSIGRQTDTGNGHWCRHGTRLMPEYTLDDSLTVFLSLHDKSMINLHLMRTSYFLFVIVLTLFCYAMVKGRPAKVKVVHISYDKISSQP